MIESGRDHVFFVFDDEQELPALRIRVQREAGLAEQVDVPVTESENLPIEGHQVVTPAAQLAWRQGQFHVVES